MPAKTDVSISNWPQFFFLPSNNKYAKRLCSVEGDLVGGVPDFKHWGPGFKYYWGQIFLAEIYHLGPTP